MITLEPGAYKVSSTAGSATMTLKPQSTIWALNGTTLSDGVWTLTVSISDKDLTVYLYDVCGTAFPRKYDVAVKDGRFSLRVPASTWKNERAYRPGWIMLDRVDDPWTFDGRRWPSEAALTKEDLNDLRLNLWGVDSDRFGRLRESPSARPPR